MVEEDGWLNVAVEQPKVVEYSLLFMFDKKLERGSLSSTVLVISQQDKLKSYFYFQIWQWLHIRVTVGNGNPTHHEY